MSRNLGITECHGPVVVEEAPRPITPDEAGPYYAEYGGLPFANAHCPVCGAKYLAWFSRWNGSTLEPCNELQDLSYRRAFDDEPYVEDLPTHQVRCTITIETRPQAGGEWTVYSRKTEAM